MTQTAPAGAADAGGPVAGRLEVSLDVPNLGQAAGFYARVFDACPTAAGRRVVWFDVPGSSLCIELREAPASAATRLRLCTEPLRLQRVASRLSQSGVTIAHAGLTREGSPRSISFHDPGQNHWELYAWIGASSSSLTSGPRRIARQWRLVTRHARAAWLASAALEARFAQQRARDQTLLRRSG